MHDGEFAVDDPRAGDVRELVARHLTFARGPTPPEHAHALDHDGLLHPSITLFSFRRDGVLLAIGALKELDRQHGEVKSMHTVEAARGNGLGRAMLEHLIAAARERGYVRLSLETGTMEEFEPARLLYASAGFEPCEPFADYRQTSSNAYMTLRLLPGSPRGRTP